MDSKIDSTQQVEVCYIVLDMTHIETVARTREKLPDGFQKVDILVNNAGLALGVAAGHEVDMKVCSCKHHTNALYELEHTRKMDTGIMVQFACCLIKLQSG
jgi:NADP-dependent 3-hydroxy acid dehydrogenase YdfG